VEDFPFTYADAGVTSLMGLVSIMATEILHRAVSIYLDFIDGKETEAFAFEE